MEIEYLCLTHYLQFPQGAYLEVVRIVQGKELEFLADRLKWPLQLFENKEFKEIAQMMWESESVAIELFRLENGKLIDFEG